MNIAFSLTTPQMVAETKDVTRRLGWKDLQVGTILMAIEKGQGIKKGEHVKPLYPILVLDVRREPLDAITQDECRREGFPEMSPEQFIEMFCKSNGGCTPTNYVTRIEFRKVKEIRKHVQTLANGLKLYRVKLSGGPADGRESICSHNTVIEDGHRYERGEDDLYHFVQEGAGKN